MNITTKHTSNVNGRGQVIATGTLNGKARQKTVSWDHSISAARNHGRAAADFVQKNFPVDQWERIAQTTTHEARKNGSHVWTIPNA
jgi:hypothetical protein